MHVIFTNRFISEDKAIAPMIVCLSCVRTAAYELNDLWPSYLAHWFTFTLSGSSSKVKVIGKYSWSQEELFSHLLSLCNCGSVVTLAMYHRLQWFIHLWAQRLMEGRWTPCLHCSKEYGIIYEVTLHWALLVLGWVTVFGWVNYLIISPSHRGQFSLLPSAGHNNNNNNNNPICKAPECQKTSVALDGK